jgi:hypothetical protein
VNQTTYSAQPPITWTYGAAVTPSNSAVLVDGSSNPIATKMIYVGAAGDLKVDLANGGGTVTFSNLPVGLWGIAATKVYATGTTAGSLIALW